MSNFNTFKINYLISVVLTIFLTGCGGRAAELDNPSATKTTVTDTKVQSSINTASSVLAAQASSGVSTSSSSSPKPNISSSPSTLNSSSSKPGISTSSSRSNSSSSATSSKANTSIDLTPPSIPSDFRADAIQADRVVLAWQASVDNSNTIHYKIYRDHVQIDTIQSGDTSYYDFDVASGRPYTYSISAGDTSSNWSGLSEINLTTLNYADESSQSSSLASSVDSSNSSVSSQASTSTQSSDAGQSSVAASSQSSAAISSQSSSAPADITVPAAPAQITKINAFSTQVDISWIAATDNVGVTSYRIYRDAALIKTVAANVLTLSDSSVSPEISYWYGVSAGDAAGNWSSQRLLNIQTPAILVLGSVTLKWSTPTQRENLVALPAHEIGGYEIRYKTILDRNYTYQLVDKAATQTIITGLVGDYVFEIAVFDTNGLYSNFVAIKP